MNMLKHGWNMTGVYLTRVAVDQSNVLFSSVSLQHDLLGVDTDDLHSWRAQFQVD